MILGLLVQTSGVSGLGLLFLFFLVSCRFAIVHTECSREA